VEAAARDYERGSGVRVELTFGASQTLLANIVLIKRGDLYIPADDSYLDLARQKQLIAEVAPLAEMTAVLAIKKGFPRKIGSFKDITGLTLAQANPDVAAIGKVMREKLPHSEWEALNDQTRVFTTAVTEVANDVKLGAVDAGFIWDAMAAQYPELELIHLPELETIKGKVAAGVLKCSRRRAETLDFLAFLSAPDKGLKQFERNGFKIVPAQK
jgi:ABC-type molybdate transport system substrate-binding protein